MRFLHPAPNVNPFVTPCLRTGRPVWGAFILHFNRMPTVITEREGKPAERMHFSVVGLS